LFGFAAVDLSDLLNALGSISGKPFNDSVSGIFFMLLLITICSLLAGILFLIFSVNRLINGELFLEVESQFWRAGLFLAIAAICGFLASRWFRDESA